jgi:predicted HicB family RNase H-like nuclease
MYYTTYYNTCGAFSLFYDTYLWYHLLGKQKRIIMKYKDYEAIFYFSEEDDCFVGKVINIQSSSKIIFDAQSVSELKNKFHEMVDYFIKLCADKGVTPKITSKGIMSLRMQSSTHVNLLSAANKAGVSANKFVNQAIEQKLMQKK